MIGIILVGSPVFSWASDIPADTLSQVGPTLARQFTHEPFDPPMKDHVWMDIGNSRLFFLHFDRPVTEKGAKLIFMGDAVKGKFCAEDQPDSGKTGFVHFHKAGHDHGGHDGHSGHGGKAGDKGYWLRHIAVDNFEVMGMKFTPGIASNFMPTPPPHCK